MADTGPIRAASESSVRREATLKAQKLTFQLGRGWARLVDVQLGDEWSSIGSEIFRWALKL